MCVASRKMCVSLLAILIALSSETRPRAEQEFSAGGVGVPSRVGLGLSLRAAARPKQQQQQQEIMQMALFPSLRQHRPPFVFCLLGLWLAVCVHTFMKVAI